MLSNFIVKNNIWTKTKFDLDLFSNYVTIQSGKR